MNREFGYVVEEERILDKNKYVSREGLLRTYCRLVWVGWGLWRVDEEGEVGKVS